MDVGLIFCHNSIHFHSAATATVQCVCPTYKLQQIAQFLFLCVSQTIASDIVSSGHFLLEEKCKFLTLGDLNELYAAPTAPIASAHQTNLMPAETALVNVCSYWYLLWDS